MRVSKNSQKYQTHKKYETHEKPKRPNWRARCPLARAPRGRAERRTLSDFSTSIVAKHQKSEEGTLWWKKTFPTKITMPKKN